MFQLVFGDHELALPLPFDTHVEERLLGLLERSSSSSKPEIYRRELSLRIVDAISGMVEGSVFPPTEKQVKYAVAIARELSLQLPPEVLQHRDAMASFLGTHADAYRKRRGTLGRKSN